MPRSGAHHASCFKSPVYCTAGLFVMVLLLQNPVMTNAEIPVSFDRDIRPILSENCYHCHGPDENAREADLRLDTEQGLLNDQILTSGKAEESELYRRISSTDNSIVMPPVDSNRMLTLEQIKLIKRWINQGAKWQGHWAFESVLRPAVPKASSDWPCNEIDHFVWQRLQTEKIPPNPEADKARLLRRVKLDITGLPPTVEELDQFLADESSEAYENMVDQFLASSEFGERMAWNWLDVARYADSNGYQGDRERTMWPWRDWVIKSFNENKPYDEFTVEQLAGDLLPEATPEQKLATGFCRNHMINGEGGRIAEENRIEYIFDQTETMGTVWLGLTLTCCRCHDHKYDPISQQEYYQLFDYFNQTPVTGGGGDPQMAPNLQVPSQAQQNQIVKSQQQIRQLEQQRKEYWQLQFSAYEQWQHDELERLQKMESPWQVLQPVKVSAEHQTLTVQGDQSILASGVNPSNDTYRLSLTTDLPGVQVVRLDALRHTSMTENGLARSNSGNFVLTEINFEIIHQDGTSQPLEIASAIASYEQGGLKIANTFDGNPQSGWAVLQGKFVDRDHAGLFRLKKSYAFREGDRLVVTLHHDSVHQNHNLGHFQFSASSQPEVTLKYETLELRNALLTPATQRTESQNKLIEEPYQQQDEVYQQLTKQLEQEKQKLESVRKQIPVVMTMQDMSSRRETFTLDKGIYDKPIEKVFPGLPQQLLFDENYQNNEQNRLTLARWLVDRKHPLTARVTVNRYWQMFFGVGLVKTPEDFGSQGEKPTHPELLDWLSAEFMESGWDLKHLIRMMVTSATYRQSAEVKPGMHERDPENRLLARGSRLRMPSWMLRDQALFVSGLLVNREGGPPVYPYQPEGIWAEATFGKKKYNQDTGEKLYRRTLYSFWRRIVGPTMLFDNSPRQSCSVRDYRTNTPLHALVTLNDTTYVEAARAFAQRLMLAEDNDEQRIELAMRLATSHAPQSLETEILLTRLQKLKDQYRQNPASATALLQVGESSRDENLDPVEHASWVGICSLILNLDETLCR